MSTIRVKKRDGSLEDLNLAKIHNVLHWAVDGLHNVSVSEIELKAELQFYNGMTTAEIQETLIRSAAELISEEYPNYQFVAGRLINFDLRKRAYGSYEPPALYTIVERGVKDGFYTPDLLTWYTRREWDIMDRMIRHDRDMNIVYVGMEQIRSKYLVKNKLNGALYETPQVLYMLIAATGFHAEAKEDRIRLIKDFYNQTSTFNITLPTAIMSGLRTKTLQFSNCTLIDAGDDLKSIAAAGNAIMFYAAKRAGIGLNIGRNRGIGSPVRGGEVLHTGIVPYIKKWIGDLKACNQGGIRNASATFYYPMWHYEFEDLIVLKNNKGTDDTRARAVDYGVQLNQLMFKRLIEDGNITLFSPNEVPGLYDAFFRSNEEFEKLYVKYEKDPKIRKKTIRAIDAFSSLMTERKETGRIYIQFVDHTNTHGPFDTDKALIYMSNLCTEICQVTNPLANVEDPNGLVSLCTLAAYNLGNIKTPEDFKPLAYLTVRFLDNVLAYQDYLLPASKNSTDLYRNIGIGITNLAYFLAKHNYTYTDEKTLEFLQPFVEAYSYYTIEASMELAKERGACLGIDHTKWKKGILPVDTYKKDLDNFVPNTLLLDWNSLSKRVAEHGVRNATMMALMPVETSSTPPNSTNGIEPPRAHVSVKNSKDGALKQVVPEYSRLKNKYELLWDQKSPRGYLKIAALFTKFIDQSISTNTSYNPEYYENGEIPMSVLLQDLIFAYQIGLKTLYYFNTNDGAGEIDVRKDTPVIIPIMEEEEEEDCASCKL